MKPQKWGINPNVFRFNMVFGGGEVKLNKPQPWTPDLDGNVKQTLSNREHLVALETQNILLCVF